MSHFKNLCSQNCLRPRCAILGPRAHFKWQPAMANLCNLCKNETTYLSCILS